MKQLFILICIWSIFIHSARAQSTKPTYQKEPSWVMINNFDYNSTQLDEQAENGYVNLVLEKQVSLKQQAIYTKTAFKILSESGVQNHSTININFDPSYNGL